MECTQEPPASLPSPLPGLLLQRIQPDPQDRQGRTLHIGMWRSVDRNLALSAEKAQHRDTPVTGNTASTRFWFLKGIRFSWRTGSGGGRKPCTSPPVGLMAALTQTIGQFGSKPGR